MLRLSSAARAATAVLSMTLLPHAAAAQEDEAARCLREAGKLERLLCLSRLAHQANDSGVCFASQDKGVRWQCIAIYAEHARDAELCDSIPDRDAEYRDLRDACISDVAEAREEPELCARLVTPGLRDSCYLKLFRATGEASLCAEIADPGLKSACTGRPVTVR